MAAVAGVGAAFAPATPTSYRWSDAVVLAGLAVLVTLAASRARRWTWLTLAGLAAVAASGVWLAVAAVALVIAFATTFLDRRRIYGAVVGALAVQSLLRLDDVGFSRSSAVLFLVAVVPVVVSAYLVAPRRVRRKVHGGLAVAAGVVGVAVVTFGVASALAWASVQRATQEASNGLELARDGKGDQASTTLARAADSFGDAHALVSSWWAAPAGAVPLLAQQARAAQVVAEQGALVSASAAQTSQGADIQQLRYTDGRVDVARLAGLQAPLEDSAGVLRRAVSEVRAVDSPWLLPPLSARLDEVEAQLDGALPEVELAALAAREAPGLLGADGPRRYLVLFTQPAEARGLGGFVGNWGELTAVDGKVELTRHGRAADLNEAPGRDERLITDPPVPRDYLERYSRFRPAYWFQDVTLSPDLPSVAAAAGQIYPQAGGDDVDGVLVVDPYALATLLDLTGPIRVSGLAEPLTRANAAEYLVKGQYLRSGTAADDAARVDVLDEAASKAFDALVSGSLPAPRKLADLLSPMVAQHRLAFHPFDEGAQELARRVGADGSFPEPDGGDFFALVTQNKGNNKIDAYLQREVDYTATYAPGTGAVEATVKVRLHNDLPAGEDLPDAVVGSNDQDLPRGTNELYFSFYSPLGLREGSVDGQQTPFEYQRERGQAVYSRFVDVPAGATVELELHLFGNLATGSTYRLGVGAQPLVNRDRVTVKLQSTGDWEIVRSATLNVDPSGSGASNVFDPGQPLHLAAELARP